MAEELSAAVGWALSDAVRALDKAGSQQKSGTATFVRRDADGTCWVRLSGAESDTPVNGTMLAEASAGQRVSYRIEGGRLSVIGNASTPSVGAVHVQQAVQPVADRADEAYGAATRARVAAESAEADAQRATMAADSAQDSADTANRAANGALAGLGTLESVIDTVEWFAEHKVASTDTTVQPDKSYYEYDESTGTLSRVEPEGTENPSQEGWYELDETIQNYVASHVSTTDDGLYVSALPGGWRVLVSTGAGDYVAGVFLVDPQGNVAQATTGSGITFDDGKPFHIGDNDAFIVFDGDGGIQMGGAITLGQYGTLTQLLNAVGSSITAVEYGVGTSPTSHADITTWSSSTPAWEAGKYVWMRTTTNGLSYTYTCIQGADGQQGEDGAQILGITTAPSSYTTTTGGFTPTYRIALSTVKTQSGASEVRVGDILAYSYYHYPVGYVDASYVYCGARKSLRGAAGSGVTVSSVEYGTSASASTAPSNWDTTVPSSLPKGTWLWVRTTYSDSTTATTKSYVGTDGEDGTSLFVQSATKTDGTTTVVIADSDGHTSTLTINDGEDGANGQPGAAGDDSYVHFAWANSADGSTDFSTTASAGKLYMGVYSDSTAADSQRYQDYSWTLIKGEQGPQGIQGPQGPSGTSVTVSSSVTSYASSTSGTSAPSSGWQSTVPSVAQGSYLWTRVVTTFSDSNTATSYTASRQGENGTNGTNGTSVTVSSTAYAYQLSTSGTTVPTGTWQTTPQAPTTTQFAWTRTTTTYSDGSTAVTYTVGGKTGTNGTSYYAHVRYATSSSGANMSATPTSSTTYIGIYTGTSSTAPSSASSYTWSKYVGDKGDKGDTGPEAVVTVYPTAIDWEAGTATLAVTLRVDGTITSPSAYKWTKGTATTSLGTSSTLAVTDLNATYNCTVTW